MVEQKDSLMDHTQESSMETASVVLLASMKETLQVAELAARRVCLQVVTMVDWMEPSMVALQGFAWAVLKVDLKVAEQVVSSVDRSVSRKVDESVYDLVEMMVALWVFVEADQLESTQGVLQVVMTAARWEEYLVEKQADKKELSLMVVKQAVHWA